MRRVPGLAAVFVILLMPRLVVAQEGWGTPPPEEQPASGGWGEAGQPQQPQQPSGEWNQPAGTPQAADNESATGGTSGWGTPPAPAGAQPAPTGGAAATPPAAEREEVTGDQFRLAHRVAIGAHNHMSGAFLAAYDALLVGDDVDLTTPWLNFSFMYTFTRLLSLDIFLGFSLGSISHEGDGITNFELGLGPRLLFTLASGDHARLYTGIGLALLIGLLDKHREGSTGDCPGDCIGYDMFGFAMAVPIGFEYRFQRVPNLVFSAEFNLHFVLESFGVRTEDPDAPGSNTSDAWNTVVILGLGNPRQEDSMNIIDYLSFLTIGFHYLI
jgi:hypothetical protein